MANSVRFFLVLFLIFQTQTSFGSPWTIPSSGDCPKSLDDLEKNKSWVLHENRTQEEYLANAQKSLELLTLSVQNHRVENVFYVVVEIPLIDNTSGLFAFPSLARTNQSEENLKNNPLCSIVGVFARFVELEDPDMNFRDIPGKEFDLMKQGKLALYEIRWFDATDQHRHRWINTAVTTDLGWYSSNIVELEQAPINSLY